MNVFFDEEEKKLKHTNIRGENAALTEVAWREAAAVEREGREISLQRSIKGAMSVW